jgi:alkanesulfonate monooxygenase SsuD/methylene tetrahydromethanopterin reductase-like flavin-dependent oxidoreductase (luciferase family)
MVTERALTKGGRLPIDERTRPFAHCSVSLGLHPDDRVGATEQIDRLVRDANAAASAGFDGVTLSEHHAGFPGYLPQPLLVLSWILHSQDSIWAAPAPTLLGLRNPTLLAEELAWTAARYPNRVGLAVAPGYARTDFEAIDAAYDERLSMFPSKLRRLLDALEEDGPLGDDPAIIAGAPPRSAILRAANSFQAADHAASLGLGILLPGGEAPTRLAEVTAGHRAAGATGPAVAIVAVWLMDASREPSTSIVNHAGAAEYRHAAAPGMRQASGFTQGPIQGTPDDVTDAVRAFIVATGVTGLNVRFRTANSNPDAVPDQIEWFGASVLPKIRSVLRSTMDKHL